MRDLNFWLLDAKKAEGMEATVAVKHFLNFYSNVLGCDNWNVGLKLDGDNVVDPHTFGWVQHHYYAQSASMQIAIDGVSQRQMETAVAHEVTHLMMARLDEVVRPFMESYMPEKVRGIFHDMYIQEIEAITVKVSEAMVALRRQEQ
jgi:hypothetical protein